MGEVHLKPGRASQPVRVRHVEDQPCETGEGNHVLTNKTIKFRGEEHLHTYCIHCKVSWGDLDEQLNGSVRK